MVAAIGARIFLVVQPPLISLLRGSQLPVFGLLAVGESIPPSDFYCPLMSLPLAFRTVEQTIPSTGTYLCATKKSVEEWAEVLGRSRPRVAIVCCGNNLHSNNHMRSIGVAKFASYFNYDCKLLLLQTRLSSTDENCLVTFPNIKVLPRVIADFSDTAAVVELMDLVITVDTAVAHLAGAMGKTVWILLPYNSDWRWLAERSDSPWYKSARLFRQKTVGDWRTVMDEVSAAVSEFFKSSG